QVLLSQTLGVRYVSRSRKDSAALRLFRDRTGVGSCVTVLVEVDLDAPVAQGLFEQGEEVRAVQRDGVVVPLPAVAPVQVATHVQLAVVAVDGAVLGVLVAGLGSAVGPGVDDDGVGGEEDAGVGGRAAIIDINVLVQQASGDGGQRW